MNPHDLATLLTDINENNGIISEALEDIPKRPLGKTGINITAFGLGGQGVLEKPNKEDEAVALINRAHELGVTYFDTARAYGPSEGYYGKAIPKFRKKIFLASKATDRTRDGALRQLEQSLKHLKTDYLDLWQIHHLNSKDTADKVTGKDSALTALIEAKEQGMVKYLGITCHEEPNIMVEVANRFDFDTALCALNPAESQVKPSFKDVFLPVASQKKMGVIGMKIFGQGYLFHPKTVTTAWEPISYALSLPISTIIIGCDSIAQLEENIILVKAAKKLNETQLKDIEERVKSHIRRGAFFRTKYKGYRSKEDLERYI